MGRPGRRSRYVTGPVYNRGPETRSQRSRFGRSNLILKGNPASDWTHLHGSVCISSTCTPSPRVSGRCLRRRRTLSSRTKRRGRSARASARRNATRGRATRLTRRRRKTPRPLHLHRRQILEIGAVERWIAVSASSRVNFLEIE